MCVTVISSVDVTCVLDMYYVGQGQCYVTMLLLKPQAVDCLWSGQVGGQDDRTWSRGANGWLIASGWIDNQYLGWY